MTDDIVEKGIEKLIEKAYEFIGQVVNPPLSELGGLFADKVKFFRFKNQVNIVLKAKLFLQEKGIEPGKIPLKTLAPLINNCSWEEDPDMQTKWSSLLANAANPAYTNYIHPSYIEILSQLSSVEAKLLDLMFDDYKKAPINKKAFHLDKESTCQVMNISPEKYDVMIHNLFRLNLSQCAIHFGATPPVLPPSHKIQLTPLGYDFIKHCRFQ